MDDVTIGNEQDYTLIEWLVWSQIVVISGNIPKMAFLVRLDMLSQQEMMVHFGGMYRQSKLAFIGSLQNSHYCC